ncbi:MAG: protein kinase [Verrucomicrobiota bacterium]
MTEREIFFAALEMTTAEARAAYLQKVCGRDVTLRRKVDELLKEHFSNDSLLAGSALAGDRPGIAAGLAEEAPAQIIGRYQLLQKIGEGGFGEVWMAEQREPVKRRVALKIIKPGMDSRQIVARFEAERQALAMMDHANIARIFDADVTESGRPYFVMELVRGIKITEFCDQNQLSTPERLRLFVHVCQAIQHAHQKGIIHRDIKPSNVLVTLHDGLPVPKVIDFGIAKATQQDLTDKTVFTQFQQFIGTPAYISPEQAEMSGLDIDTRADIYSLGVLLYELLVGLRPFDAKEMMQGGLDAMRKTIREKEPVRPSTRLAQALVAAEVTRRMSGGAEESASSRRRLQEHLRQLQGDLDWIVMKCLEKDRTRRYETANGLAADVQRHINNEPVIARPPSAAYRFQKAWRRNKVAFSAGAAVAAALLVGTGVSIWQGIRARKANASEREQRLAAQTAQRLSRRFLYAAEMNLAHQALKVNNLGRARRLLEQHQPKLGEEDLRGWEWRYLWQLTRGNDPVTLTNRPTQGFSVSFSPDGRRLAVGWWDGRVDVWDLSARRCVRILTESELPHPARVAFSPGRNLLAATSGPGAVTLYDLDSGRDSVLWRVTDPGGWDVRDLAFSDDGSKLVIDGGSNPESGDAVWVIDVETSRIESRHPAGRSPKGWTHIGAARLSPDNRRLYQVRTDDWNSRIQCIDLATSKELWRSDSPNAPLIAMDISPDGRLLASASGFTDSTILLWDAVTGEPLRPLSRHTASIIDLAFTQNGRRLISAGADQTIRLWDTNTWTETQVLRGHTHEVWAIATSEAVQLIASTDKDGSLMLWRMDEKRDASESWHLPESLGEDHVHLLDHSRAMLLPPGQPPELVDLKRNSIPVSLAGIGPSDNVLGCFGTNLLCVWNMVQEPLGPNLLSNGSFGNGLAGWVTEQRDNAHASFTRTFDFTNDQPAVRVSVTNADNSNWSIQLNYPNLKLSSNLVYNLSFAAKASLVTNAHVAITQAHPDWLNLGYYRSLNLTPQWQWFTNTFLLSSGDTNARVNFSSMGDKLCTFWFADVRLQAGTIRTNQILVGELRGAEFVQEEAIKLDSGLRPTGLAYNSARRLLAWSEGTSSHSVYLTSLGSAGRRIELTSDVPGLVPFLFSEEGNYLAAAKEPDILRAWNVETRQIVASINETFNGPFRTSGWPDLAGFAANGRVLVAGILERVRNQVAFYDLTRPGQPPRFVPGGFFEEGLAVSPDGKLVAAFSFGNAVLLFDAVKGELIRTFQGHLETVAGLAFSPDGRRLFSTNHGREAVKLWDVGTGQELLTLAGADAHPRKARWSADGNVILVGPPWQAWTAPSWEEIAEAEAGAAFVGLRRHENGDQRAYKLLVLWLRRTGGSLPSLFPDTRFNTPVLSPKNTGSKPLAHWEAESALDR